MGSPVNHCPERLASHGGSGSARAGQRLRAVCGARWRLWGLPLPVQELCCSLTKAEEQSHIRIPLAQQYPFEMRRATWLVVGLARNTLRRTRKPVEAALRAK